MGSRRVPGAARLEGSLLYLSRDPKHLARLLPVLLPPSARRAALQSAGLPALAGAPGNLQMARELGHHARLRGAVADALADALPAAAPQAVAPSADTPRDEVLAAIHRALQGEHTEDWQRALEIFDQHAERLRPARDRARKASAPAGKATAADQAVATSAPQATGAGKTASTADALRVARQQLAEVRKDKARLEKQLGELRRQLAAEERARHEAEAARKRAEQRAAAEKRERAGVAKASDRERALEKRATKAEHDLGVARQKLEIVTLEREDLAAQLKDAEQFAAIAEQEGEVPSFRDRPLLAVERDLGETLRGEDYAPRILVVGGGEPQLRHRDKFAEYAEALGFRGEWRLADYVSWHKEMTKLGDDMRKRFDALVILHWNRTTFTRRAREICDAAGHKPCITCHYEGFTSLRATLQECLRQLIAAHRARRSDPA